jgi:hypothetical protein
MVPLLKARASPKRGKDSTIFAGIIFISSIPSGYFIAMTNLLVG